MNISNRFSSGFTSKAAASQPDFTREEYNQLCSLNETIIDSYIHCEIVKRTWSIALYGIGLLLILSGFIPVGIGCLLAAWAGKYRKLMLPMAVAQLIFLCGIAFYNWSTIEKMSYPAVLWVLIIFAGIVWGAIKFLLAACTISQYPRKWPTLEQLRYVKHCMALDYFIFNTTLDENDDDDDDDDDIVVPETLEEDRETVAYHEAGHAVVFSVLNGPDSVKKITIEENGTNCGQSFFNTTPTTKVKYSRLFNTIVSKLAGAIAERVMLGENSAGGLADINAATFIAKEMVARFGMGKEFGLCSREDGSHFRQADFDADVKAILAEAAAVSEKIIIDNKDKIESLAKLLLEKSTLETPDIKAFFSGDTVQKNKPPIKIFH